MNNFDVCRRAALVSLKLTCLSLIFFYLAAPAQQNPLPGTPAETVNVALPLKLCRSYQNDKISDAAIASDNHNRIFVALQSGIIEKIELPRSTPAWSSNLGGEIVSDLIFLDEKVIFLTRTFKTDVGADDDRSVSKTIIWSLNTETGVTKWQFVLDSNEPAVLDSYLGRVFSIGKGGNIVARNGSDGQKIFEKNLALEITAPPIFFENKIYIGTADNSIITVSAVDGEILAKTRRLESPASVLSAGRDGLSVGGKKGSVNFIADTTNKSRWKTRYGGEISSLSFVRGGILVASLDNFVRLISAQNGAIIWKRRLAGRISAKPLVAGAYAVMVSNIDNNAVILDLRNGKIVNQISLADKGYVLSAPLIIGNLLVFSTSKGIFGFAGGHAACSENQ